MKKTVAILSLAMLAMLQFAANAAKLTITVEINDPSLALVQQYYFGNESYLGDLEFDQDGKCTIEYPDDAYDNLMSLYVTPITPEGQETVYFLSYEVYDSEGELVGQGSPNAKTRKIVDLKTSYDGGRIAIEMGNLASQSFTLNLDGDPSKFKMWLRDRLVTGLAEGTQQISFTPDENYIYITPQGVQSLYSVCYNGNEVQLRSDAAEGDVTYYYLISNPSAGAVLDIVTDYPAVEYPVTIETNDYDFITSVTVDDQVIDAETWTSEGWSVAAGATLSVTGDRYNYIVNASSLNGSATEPTYSLSLVVEGPTTMSFDVTKIVRDKSYVAYVAADIEAALRTDLGSYMTLHHGYNADLQFCSDDNPVTFFSQYTGEDEDVERYIFCNNELIITMHADADIELEQDDVVKIYFSTSEPWLYRVNIDYSDTEIDDVRCTYDLVRNADFKAVDASQHASFDALPGTLVTIEALGDTEIYALVDGEKLAFQDGKLQLTIDNDMDIAIQVEGAGLGKVIAPNKSGKAYNLHGIEMPDANLLPAGIYVIDGEKIQIR